MAEIGKLFVTIGSVLDSKGFKKARSSINALGRTVAIFGAAYAGALGFATKKAIDLEETTAKFNTVFRGVRRDADKMAATLVKSYGVSTQESKLFLSGMQDLLVPMGMNRKAAAEMANEIVKLSVDVGSFNNMPTEQVMRDIQSAFNGMPLPMRKYGVNITQARIKQEALNMGLIQTGEELTVITKAQAVFSLIQADSADAQGDFARTSEGLANQLKIVKARIDDLVVGFGANLLPIVKDYVTLINDNVVPRTQEWIEEEGNVEDVLKKTVAVIKFVIKTTFAFVKVIQLTVEALKVANSTLISFVARAQQVGAAMTGNIRLARRFGQVAKQNTETAKKGMDTLIESVINAGIVIDEVNSLELESFKIKEEGKTLVIDEEGIKRQDIADALADKDKKRRDQELQNTINRGNVEEGFVERMREQRIARDKAQAEQRKALMEDVASTMVRGLELVARVEVLTFRTGAKAFKQALKDRLRQFILAKTQELMAAKLVALAKAVFNSATTFGAASYQIGLVVGQFAVALGALRGLQSFDVGGTVQGPPGKPVLVQALGGEKFLGRKSIGTGGGDTIIVNVNRPLTSIQEARRQADIIGKQVVRDVKRSRKT